MPSTRKLLHAAPLKAGDMSMFVHNLFLLLQVNKKNIIAGLVLTSRFYLGKRTKVLQTNVE